MNKLCRNALASCLAATFAVGGGIAVPAASGASLEQDTAVAGMAAAKRLKQILWIIFVI